MVGNIIHILPSGNAGITYIAIGPKWGWVKYRLLCTTVLDSTKEQRYAHRRYFFTQLTTFCELGYLVISTEVRRWGIDPRSHAHHELASSDYEHPHQVFTAR